MVPDDTKKKAEASEKGGKTSEEVPKATAVALTRARAFTVKKVYLERF